jgi:hypothetical protein
MIDPTPYVLDTLQRYMAIVFLWTAIITYLVWIIDYTRQVPWWKNVVGRHQVIASGFVELLLMSLLLFLSTQSFRMFTDWALVTCAGLMAVMMVWRITIWRKLDKDARILAKLEKLKEDK